MKYLALFALVFVSASASASETENEGICTSVSELAGSIMGARQSGASMSEMYDVANRTGDEAMADMQKNMILLAFDKPSYSTQEYRERAKTEFASRMFGLCLRARGG